MSKCKTLTLLSTAIFGLHSLPAHSNPQVINITAPTDRGQSYNRLDSFDIGPSGVVLNNSLQSGVSTLAGHLERNPNLAGRAAEAVLLQINSIRPISTLNGPLEVFGTRPEQVVIANPNGITVNGLSTINIKELLLATGSSPGPDQIIINDPFKNPEVRVLGAGVRTTGLDAFDIIAKKIQIDGPIGQPGKENSTRVSVQGESLSGGVLGSMYGNAITLATWESDKGITLQGGIYSEDQIAIHSDGQIRLLGATYKSASGNIAIVGESIIVGEHNSSLESSAGISMLAMNGDISIKENATLTSKNQDIAFNAWGGSIHVHDNARLAAKTGVKLQADNKILAEKKSELLSHTGDISLISDNADIELHGSIRAKDGNYSSRSNHFAMIQSGNIHAKGEIDITAQQRIAINGTVHSLGHTGASHDAIVLKAGELIEIEPQGRVTAEEGNIEISAHKVLLDSTSALQAKHGFIIIKHDLLTSGGQFPSTK